MGRLLQQQLIASYDFDEDRGRVINDSSGNGKNVYMLMVINTE